MEVERERVRNPDVEDTAFLNSRDSSDDFILGIDEPLDLSTILGAPVAPRVASAAAVTPTVVLDAAVCSTGAAASEARVE